MASLEELTEYINTFLQIDRFKDYCPNGLQVEGKSAVHSVVTGVTASQALIDLACEKNVDAILVHHGYFWRNEDARIVGIKRKRIAALIENNISLLAYHLPLDAHPQVGNNAQLGQLLGIQIDGEMRSNDNTICGSYGHLNSPMNAEAFKSAMDSALKRKSIHIHAGASDITTIGWCTGAGQGFIDVAAKQNLDAYISGEISEATTHLAREAGIHYFAAGHHATERYGVQALAEHLAKQFGIEHEFVDVDNPA
ncbi:MAG: Nif3-like dinuclear metal center hexameric protein [Gammaproteobacteria bacterium]|nr:Nif3-like dinuclear metal center hexameric protein [Gammaproteobacteria bacterium]NNC66781.1 Nif3-like dinuclear metal center hexameric protein [Gammaproteobacteria bacterium]